MGRGDSDMLIDIILVIMVLAVVFTLVGMRWKELAFIVLGGVAWIVAGVSMFNAEISYATDTSVTMQSIEGTAVFGWFFVAIGLIVMVYAFFGVLDVFALIRRWG